MSPDHAIFIGGYLIPAKNLVNGGSITIETACRTVTYYHVELDRHDLLLADGLAAESYLDTGNRAMFANGGPSTRLHPDFATAPDQRAAMSALPFTSDPHAIFPIWHALTERAHARGWTRHEPPFVTGADPHLRLGQDRIDPVRQPNGTLRFDLPVTRDAARLCSLTTCPHEQEPWRTDDRRLGVLVRGLWVRRGTHVHMIALDGAALPRGGWWATERQSGRTVRWTNGDARLPVLSGVTLFVDCVGAARYPVTAPAAQRSAAG